MATIARTPVPGKVIPALLALMLVLHVIYDARAVLA